jgi:hypothetical protein
MMDRPSPVFERDGKWWHVDETWADEFGPFKTKEEAEKKLDCYVKYLQTGEHNG